jgi:ligand-binding sensor domain-containing protein
MTAGRAVGRTGGLGVLATAALLSAGPPVRLSAQSLWRPDERVLISDFSYVRAIAASPEFVFAATAHGLVIYDRIARAWRLPVTVLDGYPAAPARVALADPVGNAVWLGTDQGWARYDADLAQWESGYASGGVIGLMLDAQDPAAGVYLESAAGWAFLPRGAITPIPGQPLPPPNRRIAPLAPETALSLAPMADALRALILTDPRLRTYGFTCAARTPDRMELYFGTSGMGVVRIDATTGQWQSLRFGLLAPAAGGLAAGSGGVWVATLPRPGTADRSGLTWVAADLASDSLVEGAGTMGLGCGQGRRLLASRSALWLACDRGLLEIGAETGGGRTRLFDAGRGLPAEPVLALAPAEGGVWAGTARGLARVAAGRRAVTIGDYARPVLSLLARGDSLWVGTADGLGLLAPGAGDIGVPDDVARNPALRTAILALARVGDVLVAVTPDHFARRDPATHAWSLTQAPSDFGAVSALAADPDGRGVWIGGSLAVAFWDLARGDFHVLRVPSDLPAAVHDLAVDRDHLWVSTDSGLVRFDRARALAR